MQTYEFYAKPENGVIAIPEQYRSIITENVMVVIIVKKPSKSIKDETVVKKKTDLLLPPTLDTRGWKFDREAANER